MLFMLCDGMHIVRRVYEAVGGPDSPEKVAEGLSSAFFSFKRAMKEHQPTHALVAFDAPGQTWRHELHPGYKADRKPLYEPLRAALPAFYERLTTELGLAVLEVPGVESDDVLAIAYTAWAQRCPDHAAVIVSGDKDMTALVAQGALVYDLFGRVMRDAAWIEASMGVKPEQVHDFLALMGDRTDGVPGVPRVGKKTAATLLQQYGTLDGVLAAAPDIPGAVGASLRENQALAKLSRELVGFKLDKPLGLRLADLALS